MRKGIMNMENGHAARNPIANATAPPFSLITRQGTWLDHGWARNPRPLAHNLAHTFIVLCALIPELLI